MKSHSSKRKRSKENPVDSEEIMQTKVKKTKETEELPTATPPETNKSGNKKRKKDKKNKQKLSEDNQATMHNETTDPKMLHNLVGEGDLEEELSPEEKRVLERKMKKILKKEEKKRMKTEGETPKKIEANAPQQALDYLKCWSENRLMWKFQKTRQTWLLQHMFDSEKVPDENFFVLLKYLEGLCGNAKDKTVEKALSLVEESGQVPEDTVVQQRAHRAREVIQLLS